LNSKPLISNHGARAIGPGNLALLLVLRAKGTTAAAGGLHVRVIELESRAFQRLYVVHLNTVEVQEAGLVDEQL